MSLVFDPNDASEDPLTSADIGNRSAKTVIDARLNDGANQTGTTAGSNGKPVRYLGVIIR